MSFLDEAGTLTDPDASDEDGESTDDQPAVRAAVDLI